MANVLVLESVKRVANIQSKRKPRSATRLNTAMAAVTRFSRRGFERRARRANGLCRNLFSQLREEFGLAAGLLLALLAPGISGARPRSKAPQALRLAEMPAPKAAPAFERRLLNDDLNEVAAFDFLFGFEPVQDSESLNRMIKRKRHPGGKRFHRVTGLDFHNLQAQRLG